MTRSLRLALLALAAPAALVAQQPADAPSVTLFNSGRVLIRRTLPAAIAAGTSTVSLPLGIFEPASLMVLEPGVKLGRVSFDGASTEEALLRRHIGEEFQFERYNGTALSVISAKLIALQPERWLVGSAIVFARPGQIRWEPSRVPSTPVSDLTGDE